MRLFPAILAIALLAACGADPDALPTRPFVKPGVSFTLTPSAARDCAPETVYRARVDWAVEGRDEVKLEIRLDDAHGPLFARSNDARGSAWTDEWMRRGLWLVLIDRESGEVLATLRAGPEACDG